MLPTIIEFLLSQNRPEGGRICHPARLQFLIPDIPPGVALRFELAPPVGYFAGIKYAATHSDEMIPYTIYEEISQAGDMYVQGLAAEDWIRDYLPYFVFFTQNSPIIVIVQNVDVLNQPLFATQWDIYIRSEKDYLRICQLLEDYDNETAHRQADEANSLLKRMVDILERERRWR